MPELRFANTRVVITPPGQPDMLEGWPCIGPITGRFASTNGYPAPHRGLDVGVPEGTRLYAPAAGRVVAFTNDGSFGKGVCLDHEGSRWYSLFAHMSDVRVDLGQVLQPGMFMGLSGNTGLSTGPHLHWQVCDSTAFPREIERSRDPLSFVVAVPSPSIPTAPPVLTDRIARLERLVAGNGALAREGQSLSGEAALADQDARGQSYALSIAYLWQALAAVTDGDLSREKLAALYEELAQSLRR